MTKEMPRSRIENNNMKLHKIQNAVKENSKQSKVYREPMVGGNWY
ncbi:hypothetical protein Amet_4276 [Alkaliphilus metalliredigens QYMF]|uniref:Uncharacterized protein n=1 Tax=Alkaliphilus metalliredigens (strain QYMF) TaxID=293826 RepID=A6TVY6_ALKMQ|nr:hypothetical protein Amet_4276 [Alkaliphilus metalliredigens QYMF]